MKTIAQQIFEEVSELEARAEAAEAKVATMTDDPVISFATITPYGPDAKIAYSIKDWEWEDEWPSISLSELVDAEIAAIASATHPDDVAAARAEAEELALVFEALSQKLRGTSIEG